jgi:YD repeat-containing protein
MARSLETSRVEGLANTQACSAVTPVNAALPSGSRKISTAWHPDWRMPIKVAEPRRLTTHVYNGQPDPFAGNAIASCAPSTAKLPDGKPIAVLCKTVEQATYDAGGAAGFAAALDTGVPSRVWTYTYNEFGQVLTSRDPRGNTTTNSYYATTTADYTRGDLEKTTGALPTHVTRFTKYNPMGQVLQSIDANNVVTDYEYDLRQRLTRQTTAGQTTTYDYWPTGQLKRVTQPDASFVSYEYDPAQRLVAVADNLGNRIEYTLDNSGRQREERVKDPAGVLKRQVSRVFDALGRTQQVTGRE